MSTTSTSQPNKESIPKKMKRAIYAISIAIPLLVAILLSIPPINGLSEESVTMLRKLPAFYSSINAITAVVLVVALIAIKKKKTALHQKLMTTALVLSVVFLLCYVVYHASVPSTTFGGEGSLKVLYLIILLSHIVLSVIVVPLVLVTFILARNQLYVRHKKLARITFPLWLYVAITGVVVYLMISPYYPQ